jgi:hypothetical protein
LVARKERTPLSLITPFQRFDRDFISPKARFESSRSSRIFFVSSGSFGFVSLQLFAERSLKRPAALGASRETIDFFLSSLWYLFDKASLLEEAGLELRLVAEELELGSLLLFLFASFFLFLPRSRNFARGDLSGGSKEGFFDCILLFWSLSLLLGPLGDEGFELAVVGVLGVVIEDVVVRCFLKGHLGGSGVFNSPQK